MKKTFDFKPKHLEKLSLRVEKLIKQKEKEDSKVLKKIKKILKF